MNRLIGFGYSLCFRSDWISDLWAPIWFRWWCPYPVIADYRAKACIASGNCGCDNGPPVKDAQERRT